MTYEMQKHGMTPSIIGLVETVIKPVPTGECLKCIDLTSETRLKGADPKPIVDLIIYTTQGNAHEFYEGRFAKQIVEILQEKLPAGSIVNLVESDGNMNIQARKPGRMGGNLDLFNCDAVISFDVDGEKVASGLCTDLLI